MRAGTAPRHEPAFAVAAARDRTGQLIDLPAADDAAIGEEYLGLITKSGTRILGGALIDPVFNLNDKGVFPPWSCRSRSCAIWQHNWLKAYSSPRTGFARLVGTSSPSTKQRVPFPIGPRDNWRALQPVPRRSTLIADQPISISHSAMILPPSEVDGFQRRIGHAVDRDGGLHFPPEDLPVGCVRLVDAFFWRTRPPPSSAPLGSTGQRVTAPVRFFPPARCGRWIPLLPVSLLVVFGVSATARTLPSRTIARASPAPARPSWGKERRALAR